MSRYFSSFGIIVVVLFRWCVLWWVMGRLHFLLTAFFTVTSWVLSSPMFTLWHRFPYIWIFFLSILNLFRNFRFASIETHLRVCVCSLTNVTFVGASCNKFMVFLCTPRGEIYFTTLCTSFSYFFGNGQLFINEQISILDFVGFIDSHSLWFMAIHHFVRFIFDRQTANVVACFNDMATVTTINNRKGFEKKFSFMHGKEIPILSEIEFYG